MSAPDTVTCPACGEPAGPDDRFCEACGAALVEEPRPNDGRVEVDVAGAAGVTHWGLRHRRNEDAMHIEALDDITVAVVCDGVSASSHPHLASHVAADAAGAVIAAGHDDAAARITRAVTAAQSAVERLPWTGRSNLGPPACTFVGAVWDGTRVVVANVGDSRAYWIGADEAACLTEDDSVARELELRGYEPHEIEASGNLHTIVRWLGADAPTEPYRVHVFVPDGPGRLVLCTDGLWNYAPEPTALAALAHDVAGLGPSDLTHTLVGHTLAAGGDDNVTVVVVDIVPDPPVAVGSRGAAPTEELPVTTFATQVDQNKYLLRGGTEAAALVRVTASGTQSGGPKAAAELVIVDVSGSMGDPITKMIAARAATVAAIDCIDDGVEFGVLAGNNHAYEVYPRHGRLATASPATRKEAAAAVGDLEPRGGTAIGSWLRAAKDLFGAHADALCHAILLTDGRNEHESEEAFAAAIAACEGVFVCDCRGVGEGWSVPELTRVGSALLGTVEYIRDPEDMAADFAATMVSSLGKGTGDVRLRVWTPQGATVRSVQQVYPTIEDLTGRREDVDERTGDYPTPPWGDEAREYHVSVTVPAREVGEESLAARVSLVVDGEALGQAKVEAVWTDEEEKATRINANVDQAAKQIDLATAVEAGMRAFDDDPEFATAKLAEARRLAEATNNIEQLALLDQLIDVEPDGTVRLKGSDAGTRIELELRSRKTGKTRRPDDGDGGAAVPVP